MSSQSIIAFCRQVKYSLKAIAQAIVEHHQGQIQVDSIVGKGTLPITVGV